MNIFFYTYPIGKVGIADNGEAICGIGYWGGGKIPKEATQEETPLIKECDKQLKEYFSGTRKNFDLPLYFKGTDFQKAVWQALIDIPYAQTVSYKDIAEKVGSPKACRAVGMANNKNPIAIIAACHRVIGHGGKSLVGYAGGLDIKQFLLDLEKQSVNE